MHKCGKYSPESFEKRLSVLLGNGVQEGMKIADHENMFKQNFRKIFRIYGLDDFNRRLTKKEFETYTYKLFVDIKSELGSEGWFNPSRDIPNITGI